MFRYLFVFFVGFSYCFAEQTICLNMIVKDEAKIITRCLDSVKNLIDYWVIVDTGSSDGTQQIIKEYLKDLPGELHERPWKNWGETRTEAYQLAMGKGDYILFMDADDILELDPSFEMPVLTEDCYNMWRGNQSFSYQKPQIVRGNLSWKWVGVTHEYLDCDEPTTSSVLDGIHYTSVDDGATRSLGVEKYWKNVHLLEEGMKLEPNNSRYAFYLAESYRDAGEKAKALEWYQKRVRMGGWAEEIFCSKLQTAHMLRDLGLPFDVVLEAYKDAFGFRPHRIEPIYYIAEMYNREGNYKRAYEVLQIIDMLAKPKEKDVLFNEDWISDFGILFQKSICAYYMEQYQEALDACDQLLENKLLPEAWRALTETNRSFPLAKLQEIDEKMAVLSVD